MKSKKLYLLLLYIIFLISLFPSCRKQDDDFFVLDSGWTYSLDNQTGHQYVFDSKDFKKINNLLPNQKGYVYLKKYFIIPDNLQEENIGIYLGNVYLAHELYINDIYIGGKGKFPPNEFYEGAQVYSYIIPKSCLNNNQNKICIKLWVDGIGQISTVPFISTEQNIISISRIDNFKNSKIYLMSSYLMFVIFLIYIFLYHLRPKEKSNFSFSMLALFTAFYLTNVCIGEYPITISENFSLLLFQKFFNGIIPIGTIYFAVSFIRDFLKRKDTKARIIYRISLTFLSFLIVLLPKSMDVFLKSQFLMYCLGAIHIFYAVRLIIEESIKKSKLVLSLLFGFSPVLITLFIEAILVIFKVGVFYLAIVLSWQVVILLFLSILIRNFAQTTKNNEYLNNNLEKIVEERTSELTFTNRLLEKTNFNLEYEKKRAEKEIELASFVQQSFYRHSIPIIDDWEIAYYSQALAGVSGDLYDFYTNQNVLDGLGIFDVSGHGISSGLVTMLVKNIIQQEFVLGTNEELSEVMNKINNRVISEKGNIENYLTGILIRIKENKIELVNAGHPQPVIYNSESKKTDFYENPNQNRYGVIGISDFPINFDTINISLNKNDEILLYTDGILDCKNINKEDFGKDRLLEAFKNNIHQDNLADQVNGIINELNNFISGKRITDDVTIVILKKK